MDKVITEETLFVLPLDDRFKCPTHNGLLQSPVKNSCGHNFCQACIIEHNVCPVDRLPLCDWVPNTQLQVDIDSLLCYCKFGVMRGSSGELIPDPNGCSMIIKYGNRLEHEAACDFNEKDFCFIEVKPPTEDILSVSSTSSEEGSTESSYYEDDFSYEEPVPSSQSSMQITPCRNKDDGCFFLAESESELANHLSNECSFERLRNELRENQQRIVALEQQVATKDAEINEYISEIARLRTQLEEFSVNDEFSSAATMLAKRTMEGSKELWDELAKIFGEEIPNGLNAARESLSQTNAIQKTSGAFSTFRSKIIRKTNKVKQDLSEVHPLDKFMNILATLKDEFVSSVRDAVTDLQALPASDNILPSSNNASVLQPQVELILEEEEAMKKQIQASIESYEEEKQKRAIDTREQSDTIPQDNQ